MPTTLPSYLRIAATLTQVALLALLSGCAPSNTSHEPKASAESPGVDPISKGPEVTQAQAAFYQQAVPAAQRFAARIIPKEMIRSLDKGNDIYVIAYDSTGEVIGYLRDFFGPVTVGEDCPCDPLQLTLAFDSQYNFVTLIAPKPLQKYGHQPMTAADLNRLIGIVEKPSQTLLDAKSVEAVVDATTGATMPIYKGHVVAQAALSTRRIVGLVQDTVRILKGAPLAWDRQQLQKLFEDEQENPQQLLLGLAAFLPRAESEQVELEAYRVMAARYLAWTRDGGEGIAAVESRIIDPKLKRSRSDVESLNACYRFAAEGLRISMVESCVKHLKEQTSLDKGQLSRLVGTLNYLSGNMKEALPDLEQATKIISLNADPMLHLRLAGALQETGDKGQACDKAKALFSEHPLLPQIKGALRACDDTDVASLIDTLRKEQKVRLLSTRLSSKEPVPMLPVEDDNMQGIDLKLHTKGKVTVAVFFATWCPHCRVELPRIKNFVRLAAKHPKLQGQVRVVGIRTAIEKETEPYATFKTEFDLNFPVYNDAVMALAFSKFAKSQGLAAGIPTVAIIDEAGLVQFILPAGDHYDTARQLMWATEAVVGLPSDN